MAGEVSAPSGTVTFLFTDIEGSTQRWDREPLAMQAALDAHDRTLRATLAAHGGYVFAVTGDGFGAAFERADDAVFAAASIQSTIGAREWETEGGLRVRIGVHTGSAVEREGNYFGPAVNVAARVMGLALGGQILTTGVTAAIVTSSTGEIDLRSVGEAELTGVTRPVEVFVLGGDGLVTDVELAPRRTRTSSSEPPRYLTSFIGRESELDDLVDDLARPGIVTMVGPGGMGKTRLSSEATTLLASQTGRPVWFCDLARLSDPEAVGHEVAMTVGASPPRNGDVVDAVIDALRLSDGVVVLDNCEHVLRSAAELAFRLATGCPKLTVLATSRAPLGVSAERLHPLSELKADGDAAELMTQRMNDVAPGFVDAVGDRDAIVSLCRHLDGMPLAIELAAAQARYMSPDEIAAQLDDRFGLLRSDAPDRPDRQQSVEATVAWSFELLSPTAQRLLEIMSVFAGPVDLEFIGALWSASGHDGRVSAPLGELVDRSMAVVDRKGKQTRFRLLETIRAFGLMRLAESQDPAAIRIQHAELVVARLDAVLAEVEAPGGGDFAHGLAELWPELRSAVHTAVSAGAVSLATDLTWQLGQMVLITDRAEAGDWVDSVLAMPGIDDDDRVVGVLATGALTDWITGRYEIGYDRALRIQQLMARPDPVWCASVGNATGIHQLVRGDAVEAIALSREAVQFAATRGGEYARLQLSLQLVQFETMTDNTARAQELLAEVTPEVEAWDSVGLRSFWAHSTAVAWLDDDPERVLTVAREGLELCREHGFAWTVGTLTNYATAALVRVGDLDEAKSSLEQSIAMMQAGAAVQSATNTMRNAVVFFERIDRLDLAAPLVGWLDASPTGIPGTPGMRQHVLDLKDRLPELIGAEMAARAMAKGAGASTKYIVELASDSLAAV